MVDVSRVVLARRAREELARALAYYRRTASADQAKRNYTRFREALLTLETFPEKHSPLAGVYDGADPTLRFAQWYEYKVIFRVEEGDDTIVVLGVRHNALSPRRTNEGLP